MRNLLTRRSAGVAGIAAAVAIPLALLTGCPAPFSCPPGQHWTQPTGVPGHCVALHR